MYVLDEFPPKLVENSLLYSSMGNALSLSNNRTHHSVCRVWRLSRWRAGLIMFTPGLLLVLGRWGVSVCGWSSLWWCTSRARGRTPSMWRCRCRHTLVLIMSCITRWRPSIMLLILSTRRRLLLCMILTMHCGCCPLMLVTLCVMIPGL